MREWYQKLVSGGNRLGEVREGPEREELGESWEDKAWRNRSRGVVDCGAVEPWLDPSKQTDLLLALCQDANFFPTTPLFDALEVWLFWIPLRWLSL